MRYLCQAASIQCPFGNPCTLEDLSDPNCSLGFPEGCPLKTKQVSWIDLPHISQFFSSRSRKQDKDEDKDKELLRDTINPIYGCSYTPNILHKFLATTLIKCCNCQKQETHAFKGLMSPYPLIVTTCFDRTLERAFYKYQQPYDLLSYSSEDMDFSYRKYDFVSDKFGNEKFGEASKLISVTEASKDKDALSLNSRPVILRLYGPIYKEYGEHFAITEDHFLKYLIHCSQGEGYRTNIPINLLDKLRLSHLWFLGYNLSYWYLRIILHLIAEGNPSWPEQLSWAIQEKPQRLERELWDDINNEKLKLFSHRSITSLKEYIVKVSQKLNPQGITSNLR